MLQVGDQRTAASSFQVTARGSHRLAEIDPNVLVAIASRASTVMRRMASIIAQSIFSPIPLSGVTLFDSFEKTTVQDARVHESSTPRLKKKLVRKPSAAWCWRRRFLLLAKEDSRHHQPPLRARLLKCRARFHGPSGNHAISLLSSKNLEVFRWPRKQRSSTSCSTLGSAAESRSRPSGANSRRRVPVSVPRPTTEAGRDGLGAGA